MSQPHPAEHSRQNRSQIAAGASRPSLDRARHDKENDKQVAERHAPYGTSASRAIGERFIERVSCLVSLASAEAQLQALHIERFSRRQLTWRRESRVPLRNRPEPSRDAGFVRSGVPADDRRGDAEGAACGRNAEVTGSDRGSQAADPRWPGCLPSADAHPSVAIPVDGTALPKVLADSLLAHLDPGN
jgi:hypothetical protein